MVSKIIRSDVLMFGVTDINSALQMEVHHHYYYFYYYSTLNPVVLAVKKTNIENTRLTFYDL